MSQRTDLVDELKSRLRAVWGAGLKISVGRPKVPFTTTPYAVISLADGINQTGSGRSVIKDWNFTIIGVFEFDHTKDSEDLALDKAELLVMNLEPYSETPGDVPSVDPPFAGIADEHYVVSYSPMEEKLEDAFVGCVVEFTVKTTVHA